MNVSAIVKTLKGMWWHLCVPLNLYNRPNKSWSICSLESCEFSTVFGPQNVIIEGFVLGVFMLCERKVGIGVAMNIKGSVC